MYPLLFAEDDKLRPGEDVKSTSWHQKFEENSKNVPLEWPTWQVPEIRR